MKKIFLILTLFITLITQAQIGTDPSFFKNGIKLGKQPIQTSTDTITIPSVDGVINKIALKDINLSQFTNNSVSDKVYDSIVPNLNGILFTPSINHVGELWWAFDVKLAYKSVMSGGESFWQEQNIKYKEINDTFVFPTTRDGQTLNAGQELIQACFNDGIVSATESDAKVFFIFETALAQSDFFNAKTAVAGDLSRGITYGLSTTDALVGESFKLVPFGDVRDQDTSAYPIGTKLWVDPLLEGEYTDIVPISDKWFLGIVKVQDAVNGVITVNTLGSQKDDVLFSAITSKKFYFTGDPVVTAEGGFILVKPSDRGIAAQFLASAVAGDNSETASTTEFLLTTLLEDNNLIAGEYGGQIDFEVNTSSGSEQVLIEMYYADDEGVPIDVVVSPNPVGTLGVKPLMVFTTTVLNMDSDTQELKPLTAALTHPFTALAGNRFRYVVIGKKIGTAGGNKTFLFYYGSDHGTYTESLAEITTDEVVNASGVTGLTTSDALNTLNNAHNSFVTSNLYTANGDISTGVSRIVSIKPNAALYILADDGAQFIMDADFDIVGQELKLDATTNVTVSGLTLDIVSSAGSGLIIDNIGQTNLLGKNDLFIKPGTGGVLDPVVDGDVLTAVGTMGKVEFKSPLGSNGEFVTTDTSQSSLTGNKEWDGLHTFNSNVTIEGAFGEGLTVRDGGALRSRVSLTMTGDGVIETLNATGDTSKMTATSLFFIEGGSDSFEFSNFNSATGNLEYAFPASSGTLALLSDIGGGGGNFVTTNTSETNLTGTKEWIDRHTFKDGIEIAVLNPLVFEGAGNFQVGSDLFLDLTDMDVSSFVVADAGNIKFAFDTEGFKIVDEDLIFQDNILNYKLSITNGNNVIGTHQYNLPDVSGTFALLSDVITDVVNTGTSNYTLVFDDINSFVTLVAAPSADKTVEIPTNAVVPFPIGTEVEILLNGFTNSFSFINPGVTLSGDSTSGAVTGGLYRITKIAIDTWFVLQLR